MQRTPPQSVHLDEDHVHVWQVATDRISPATIVTLRGLLDADEIARAGRFHFERDRRAFIIARGLLRTLLGNYLNADPAQIEFCYGPYGKPELAPSARAHALQFNLAHTRGLIVYVFSHRRRVGVDVEYLSRKIDYLKIAREYFSPHEVSTLMSLPPAQQGPAFFHGWARKEAYLKARGAGIVYGLDQFDVSLHPGEPAALLADRKHPAEVSNWRLESFTPAPAYAAALAVEGTEWTLQFFEY